MHLISNFFPFFSPSVGKEIFRFHNTNAMQPENRMHSILSAYFIDLFIQRMSHIS